MTEAARFPAPLARWAEAFLGPLQVVRDTSHARSNSQVWEVVGATGRHFVKRAPAPVFYTRETHAYRAAVPQLGFANAPILTASSAELLALVLTAVDGAPLTGETSAARRRTAHRQAGHLLRRFHEALPDHETVGATAEVAESTLTGLEVHLAAAGEQLSTAEADMLRRIVGTLPFLGPLPAGLRHGDFWERNLLWNGRRCALIDFERSAPGPLVTDFVKLACTVWPDHPELREALLVGYGRPLSETERQALVVFAAADAASALAYGSRQGDTAVSARGRRTVERLAEEGRR